MSAAAISSMLGVPGEDLNLCRAGFQPTALPLSYQGTLDCELALAVFIFS